MRRGLRIRRACGRLAAQSVVVGEAEFVDPFGSGAAAMTAHGMRGACDHGMRGIRRQRFAAMPAGAGVHGESSGCGRTGRATGTFMIWGPLIGSGGSA